MRPELLTQPNIPKPLHGLNPRTLKGQKWWDTTRREVYASNGFCCAACGVHKTKAKKHKWLEAHEIYNINYKTGKAVMVEIVPLCHYCHSFIHSGRLEALYKKRQCSKVEAAAILTHGLGLLQHHGLKPFYGTLAFYGSLMNKSNVVKNAMKLEKEQTQKNIQQDWSKWHLVLEGKKYPGLFKNMRDWEKYYAR